MSYVLLTNDDGIDSPALRPFLTELARRGEVRAVVPDRERSWIGKAITRWDSLEAKVVDTDPLVYTVDGYPADCTNLGVHTLFESPPAWVVSGINVGLNYGLGFFLSSGTVGAAAEGWIAGLPAVAFSMGDPEHDRDWKKDIAKPEFEVRWREAAALCADVFDDLRSAGMPPDVDLMNVNFPVGATVDTPREVTALATVGYDQLFYPEGEGRYAHAFRGGITRRAPLDGTDIAAVRAGRVSITPVRLAHAVPLRAELKRRLERKNPPEID